MIIHFVQPDGNRQEVETEPGMTIMEVAREANIRGILAECGGGAICSTCHVHLDPSFFNMFPAKDPTEDMLLDLAPGRDEWSRLSCQIELSDQHDGLVVNVPAEQSDY